MGKSSMERNKPGFSPHQHLSLKQRLSSGGHLNLGLVTALGGSGRCSCLRARGKEPQTPKHPNTHPEGLGKQCREEKGKEGERTPKEEEAGSGELAK